jgi:hypothetical protein
MWHPAGSWLGFEFGNTQEIPGVRPKKTRVNSSTPIGFPQLVSGIVYIYHKPAIKPYGPIVRVINQLC